MCVCVRIANVHFTSLSFSHDYRVRLNRPLDTDGLLLTTGWARVLFAFRLWSPWWFESAGDTDAAEAQLLLSMTHNAAIRREMLYTMWSTLRSTVQSLISAQARV